MARDDVAVCTTLTLHPEALERARAALPGADTIARASVLLKALADPTRMRILLAMKQGELCVCDLSHLLGMSQSAISHQLRVLRDNRLVSWRREGRQVFYRLADRHVEEILEDALEHAGE
ncbi:ArsR/SmtB family transcription factor [Deinococcota bacterium DY0809b]